MEDKDKQLAVPQTDQGLLAMNRGELLELFRRSEMGPSPLGHGRGVALLFTGGFFGKLLAWLVWGVAWRGKILYREGYLKNLITPFGIPAIEANVYEGESWEDKKPAIILDYSQRSRVAWFIRDEIRMVAPGLYLGLVFIGRWHALGFSLTFGPR